MTPKIRNIIIFVAIAAVFVLIYIFFIKSSPDQNNLVSSPTSTTLPDMNGTSTNTTDVANATSLVAKDFLTLLLDVKNINLDDSIFSDQAFNSLHDSSIVLTPDAVVGRPNPFAQLGNDPVPVSTDTTSATSSATSTTPAVPTTPAPN
jgi:hypothetical protein